jgi:uncharacterized protein YbbC (DUF1343 family)
MPILIMCKPAIHILLPNHVTPVIKKRGNSNGYDMYVKEKARKKYRTNIDLVLIDLQSVGKRSLHLIDTVNTKKRRTNIY